MLDAAAGMPAPSLGAGGVKAGGDMGGVVWVTHSTITLGLSSGCVLVSCCHRDAYLEPSRVGREGVKFWRG